MILGVKRTFANAYNMCLSLGYFKILCSDAAASLYTIIISKDGTVCIEHKVWGRYASNITLPKFMGSNPTIVNKIAWIISQEVVDGT